MYVPMCLHGCVQSQKCWQFFFLMMSDRLGIKFEDIKETFVRIEAYIIKITIKF